MTTFHLQIATMDGNVFDGQVQSVSCRTIHGDLAILARHMNYCTAIGMGTAHVVLERTELLGKQPASAEC